MNLPALVLAAGRSTRIAALTGGGPKPLLEVAGRTLLEWNLRWLADAGCRRVWINLHHEPQLVRRAVAAMALDGVAVEFSEEETLLGTAGAWRRLAEGWGSTGLVVYGDNLTRFDLRAFEAAHVAGGAPATLALFDPRRHGNTGIAGSRVVVDGSGQVTGFEEVRGGRAGGMLVSTGACILEPELAARFRPGVLDFGADVFPTLASGGELRAHVMEEGGFCLGLDTPEHYETGRELVETGAVRLS